MLYATETGLSMVLIEKRETFLSSMSAFCEKSDVARRMKDAGL